MTKAEIAVLRPQDRLQQDGGPVMAIYRDLGPMQAERIVARTLGELALILSSLAAAVRAHRMRDMARPLRRLQNLSQQMGLVSLAAAAGDLRNCLDTGDATAFSAVWARLLRVAERSLALAQGALDHPI